MPATALKISPQQKKKKHKKKRIQKKIHTKFTQCADFESEQKTTTHNNNETNLPKKERERERDKIEKLECIKRKAKQMIGQRNN